jgi:hypothetical protein
VKVELKNNAGGKMENELLNDAVAPPEKDENNTLRLEIENLRQDLKTRDDNITVLEQALEEKTAALSAAGTALEQAKQLIVESTVDLSQAVAAYRDLSGQSNPGLVAEMIKGDTITEINASVKNARELVARVRQEIEAGTASVSVPAGAPPRTVPDLSALSAREKIKFAVEGR